MKIAIFSISFDPAVGGIETVSRILAQGFSDAGHNVTLITETNSVEIENQAFRVVRRPSKIHLIREIARADVVLHSNISLKYAWPLLAIWRPWFIIHHTWIPRLGLSSYLKRLSFRLATNISVSVAVQRSLAVTSTLIYNPYDAATFKSNIIGGRARSLDLIYVGRLVSDKGVDRLVDALDLLAKRHLNPNLIIIGDGPEMGKLRQQVLDLGLTSQVSFAGIRTGDELAQLMLDSKVLVVPSIWEEPFGIVAIEAMACGCLPIVTDSGGLPEAVGSCGLVVRKDSPQSLADAIALVLLDSRLLGDCLKESHVQLARHQPMEVIQRYFSLISQTSMLPH